MSARLLDWIKMNQAFVTGFVLGLIAGGVLGMLGAWLK